MAPKNTRSMSPATKKKIIAVIDEELRTKGVSFEEAAEVVEDAGAYVAQGFNAGILVQVKRMLDQAQEPRPDELGQFIDDLRKRFIYELRPAAMQAFKEFKKKLPYQRGGGRPEALPTANDKSSACDAVSAHVRKGVPLKQAFMRVAQEFTTRLRHHVSARSVQRAWQGRNKGY